MSEIAEISENSESQRRRCKEARWSQERGRNRAGLERYDSGPVRPCLN